MTEPTQPLADTGEDTELTRLLALARMSEQERINACNQEVSAVFAKWCCVPVALPQFVNGMLAVQPGIQALPIQLSQK